MENAVYCVWCGHENPPDGKTCGKCGKELDAQENLLVEFLVDHTKDKLKGDIEDGIFNALKNYLLSHLYSVIITVALVVTATAAVVMAAAPSPDAHIEKVSQAPATQSIQQEQLEEQETMETQETTEPGIYLLTQEDKEEIYTTLRAFTDCMETTRYIGGDYDYLNYMISDELETAIGYDSYVDMYPDQVSGDIYQFNHCEYGELTIDQETWSTEPLTQNGKELVDMGYTIATFYADYSFYGKLYGSNTAPTELIASPRYLMTFTIENGQWLLVEQINMTDRLEERQDAFL